MARRHKPTPRTSPLIDDPVAVTTGGIVVANVTHVFAKVGDDPHELLDAALAAGRQVLLGVALDERETADAMKRLDDAAAEVVAMVVKL